MAIQIKDTLKTVGGISTSGAITTTGNGSHSIGSTSNRFNTIIGTNIHVYDVNAQHYASLRTTTVGTADTQGVGRLVAGNNVASGTAGNAKGQVLLYGTNTGYTALTPGNNTTSNATIELPSVGGKLMMAKQDSSEYWGIVPPNGSDAVWVRTPKSGLLPYEKNSMSSSIGSTTWPFCNMYGRLFGIYDTNGQTYGSMRIQTAGTAEAQGETRIMLGNSLATGVANNSYGRICLYGKGAGYTYLTPGNNGDSGITLTLPSSGGTLARTADIDSKVANYLPLAGGTMTGPIKNGSMAGSWVEAANGNSIINSTRSAGGFHPLASGATNNGKMVLAMYQGGIKLAYLTKENCDNGANTVSSYCDLFNEDGTTALANDLTVNGGGNIHNINQINFRAHADDGAHIKTTISGNQTYLDFAISDDAGTDRFRWIGNLYNSADGTHPDVVAMELYPHLNGAELYLNGSFLNSGSLYMTTNNTYIYGKFTDGTNQPMLRITGNNVTDVGNIRGTTCILSGPHPTHYDGSNTYTLHSDKNHHWGYFSTNGGQDFLGRGKRCMVATEGELVINYGPDFTQTRFHGIVQVDAHIKINGTPVSVQSGAPSVGGVWIQI